MLEEIKTRKWRWGVNRWIILLFVILGVIGVNYYPPLQPHIQVAAENLSGKPLFNVPILGEVYLTNTMLAMLVVDVILILIVLAVQGAIRSGSLVPKGITSALEALFESLYGMTEGAAGAKWGRIIFPYFAIIMLFVLVANLTKLIPGYESIGFLHSSDHGSPIQQLAPGVYALVKGDSAHTGGYNLIGFLRGLPTDLNFTVALAIFSVFMTQVVGVRAHGLKYFVQKFFNVLNIFSKPGFGVIDFAVSILELISEFAKILSFSFRLFGNMFAGLVLLILIGTMLPVFAQSGILLFEFFIGLIQAFVFGILTMVFMSQAVASHGGD
ncbi:MAG: F0F1 ATP synthase subunit A [Anaerolineaceae bacterium]|nr:F0F1 ATP synthase subunit A [Anaerolineaceae bacterium]